MENKNSNLFRDFLLIILSVILSITGIIVANNYGLINLKNTIINTTNNTNTTSSSQNSNLATAIATAKSCSVAIVCKIDETSSGVGSGVILNYDSSINKAYIITNYHVINEISQNNIRIYTNNVSKPNGYIASLVGADPENDIAILSFTPDEKIEVAKIGLSLSETQIDGSDVIAVGTPYGYPFYTTIGIISGICEEKVSGIEKYYLQPSASINPGNSGGGLFNNKGELIGINTLKFSGAESIAFALPMLFDSTISLTNTNYNINKRDALTSFNCLLQSHKTLIEDASKSNKVGYISSHKTVGAIFEDFSVINNLTNKLTNHVYIENALDTDDYNYLSITGDTWSAPTSSGTETTFYSIVSVQYSTNGTTWFDGNNVKTLIRNESSNFNSVNLMNFINSQPVGTFIKFKFHECTINSLTDSFTESSTDKTLISIIKNYQYCLPTA